MLLLADMAGSIEMGRRLGRSQVVETPVTLTGGRASTGGETFRETTTTLERVDGKSESFVHVTTEFRGRVRDPQFTSPVTRTDSVKLPEDGAGRVRLNLPGHGRVYLRKG